MGRKKLTPIEWSLVKTQLQNGSKTVDVAREYGVPESTVRYYWDKERRDRRARISARRKETSIIEQMEEAGNDERFVTLTLQLLASCGQLNAMLGNRGIASYKMEFSVHIGRIDMLIVHGDGGLSLIEAKAIAGVAQMAGGIGQLLAYKAALLDMVGGEPPYIHCYLAAPVEKLPCAGILSRACAAGGVKLISLPAREVWRGKVRKLYERDMLRYHGTQVETV